MKNVHNHSSKDAFQFTPLNFRDIEAIESECRQLRSEAVFSSFQGLLVGIRQGLANFWKAPDRIGTQNRGKSIAGASAR